MSYSDKKSKRPNSGPGASRQGRAGAQRPRPATDYPQGFASCPRGLEELLAEELRAAGIGSAKPTAGGVRFSSALTDLYRACLWSRVASRVMLTIAGVDARDDTELYNGVVQLPWEQHLDGNSTIAVDFIGTSETLRNSQFSARRVKDGIVDRLRSKSGARPDVELRDPDLRVIARLHRGHCAISIDFSGTGMHRRGYRQATGAAPLKENLAAAILLRAGWPELAAAGGALVDPLCGSGTLLIEGAQMAAGIAPGLSRELAPREWPRHDRALWQSLVDEARERARAAPEIPPIVGADADPRVVETARLNVAAAGLQDRIRIEHAAVGELGGIDELPPGLMVCNPPYGERISAEEGLDELYSELGELIRTGFADWCAAVLTAEGALPSRLGIRYDRQYRFRNGTIECRLLVFSGEKVLKPGHDPDAPRETPPLTDEAQMVANRIRKNLRRLKSWLADAGTDCYRVYDADIPEYAVAIDRYGDCVHIAEYAPPSTIDPRVAQQRLRDVRAAVAEVFDVSPDQVALKTRSRQRGKTQYQRHDRGSEMFEVREGPARLLVNLHDYLDTGLFLDHRRVRRMVASMASGKRFLNLFCYTASVSVQAALGGAVSSTSVDMSATYLEWAEKNFRLNAIDPWHHRVVRADCLSWPKQQKDRWDLIFLDPPSFSNSKRMDATLDVQRDHAELIRDAATLLAPGGQLIFSTNRRGFKIDAQALQGLVIDDITADSYDPDFDGGRTRHYVFCISRR